MNLYNNIYKRIFKIDFFQIQLVTISVLCALGKLEEAGLEPRLKLKSGMKTFLGLETVHKWVAPNIWIGPPEKYLISKLIKNLDMFWNPVEVLICIYGNH